MTTLEQEQPVAMTMAFQYNQVDLIFQWARETGRLLFMTTFQEEQPVARTMLVQYRFNKFDILVGQREWGGHCS